MKDIVAFWGYPRKELIQKFKEDYPNASFIDLDINYGYPDIKFTPDAYCTIIKNIINNAFYLKDRIIAILASIGKDKCDSAYFVSEILKDYFLPISKSILPLRTKIELITKNIIEQKDYGYLKSSKAKFGFWGVPPNDLSILELFPQGTEVFGWIRAVEAGYPGDFEIETYVDDNIPTIFFTQAFCSKTNLAKYLANKHQGLFIDIDTIPLNSAKAKIEAFLKLR